MKNGRNNSLIFFSTVDIGWGATGADDTMNKIMIGLKKVDQKNLTKLEQILKELNIPLDAVYVKEMVVKANELRTYRSILTISIALFENLTKYIIILKL